MMEFINKCVFGLALAPALASLAQAECLHPIDGSLSILGSDGREKASYRLLIAGSDSARQNGLMHYRYMAQDIGMLFVFDESQPLAFWMKDTFIPLDIIFFDEKGRVVVIHENTTPFSLEPLRSHSPVRYALEVNAGQAAANSIMAGDSFDHEDFGDECKGGPVLD
jgi:uncharacterized membrane protein (UPF0127 family)